MLPLAECDSCENIPLLRVTFFFSYLQVPGAMSAHPHLFYSGDKPEASSTFLVTFEDLKLTAVDITDGFALLLAAYWAFNVQYAQKAKRTFLLLETLMDMEPSSLLPCVVKAATAIDSA